MHYWINYNKLSMYHFLDHRKNMLLKRTKRIHIRCTYWLCYGACIRKRYLSQLLQLQMLFHLWLDRKSKVNVCYSLLPSFVPVFQSFYMYMNLWFQNSRFWQFGQDRQWQPVWGGVWHITFTALLRHFWD